MSGMRKEPDSLPNDIDQLKSLLIEHAALNQKLTRHNKKLEIDKNIAVTTTKRTNAENDTLKSKLIILERSLACSSEFLPPWLAAPLGKSYRMSVV